MASTSAWRAKAEERRQQEESKKRAAIVAVNDISFPALGGSSAGAGGWGTAEASPPVAKATPPTSYSERLKTAVASPMAGAGAGSSTTSARDQAAELAVFRHRPVATSQYFGTSRSSCNDTYYDNRDAEPTYDEGWNVVDKKKIPTTKSKINYNVDLTDDDYADGCGGDEGEPNSSW
jgi:hypothetical protein